MRWRDLLAASLSYLILAVVICLLMAAAFGAPPAGVVVDDETSGWYHSLEQPGTGYPCCSIADCRPVVTRDHNGHIEAFIDRKSFGPAAPDDWIRVPENHMLRGKENPTGEEVACWFGGEIRCFVGASGT